MCGIAGFVDFSPRGREPAEATLVRMRDTLVHRGPDASGATIDEEGRVAFGHRRLAIIDLSSAGAQPMASESGRYVVSYNGEIYGFLRLRRELEAAGKSFRGQSDTEVLLAAIESFGIDSALSRINGMFAFALFDRAERQVTFVRDRLGKKPLYIGVRGSTVAFASEIKALRAHADFASPPIDMTSVSQCVRLGYIPAPRSIFENVIKLPPGCSAEFSIDGSAPSLADILSSAKPFWTLPEAITNAQGKRFEDEKAALDTLEREIFTAVQDRLISDVPVGAFLSGGIDSSLVCAMMSEVSGTDARTYTVRFEEGDFNEADHAAEVASFLGTTHTELTATPEAVLNTIADVVTKFDEPFADPSQVPTYLISGTVRSQMTVALSGDGGDESFGGYRRYANMLAMEKIRSRTPGMVANAAAALPVSLLDLVAFLGRKSGLKGPAREARGDRIKKMLQVMDQPDFRHRYEHFLSQWSDSDLLASGSASVPTPFTALALPDGLDLVEQMMFLDSQCYLPDDVLVKVDRTSMAFGLEVRSPLLDHKVVETAWRLPQALRFGDGTDGKVALRKLLERRMPRKMFDRPKKGFGLPLNTWLRGPLREYAEELLSETTLREIGIFNHDIVRRKWAEHLDGKRNWGFHIWTLMVFNSWYRQWK